MYQNETYYLWLTPEETMAETFRVVIRRLSREYKSRLFQPHVTLASGIRGQEKDLISKTYNLASKISGFTVQPKEFAYRDEFYRAFFIAIKPEKQLLEANLVARQIFDLSEHNDYMPHLSLFYGNLPVREKDKIKQQLDVKLLRPFKLANLVLFCTDFQTDDWYPVESVKLD